MDESKIINMIMRRLLRWKPYGKNMYKTNEGLFCGLFNPFLNAGDLIKVLNAIKHKKYLVTIELNVFNMWSCEIDNGKRTVLTTENDYEKAILYSVYKLIK